MKTKLKISSLIGLISVIAIVGLMINGNSKAQNQSSKQNSHTEHSVSQNHSDGEHGTTHNHNAGETQENAQAKLTVAQPIEPNKPIKLVIDIQDQSGKTISKFDTFQEQLMHLILVSEDLQIFNHIHPEYKGNGRFEVTTQFPKAGKYALFTDYKPTGQKEQVSVLNTEVPGNSNSVAKVDFNRNKTFGNTKANLGVSESSLTARKPVSFVFSLKDAATNQPVKDLQPYLGERGHLVIVKQSSPLTKADYIHAHAHTMTNLPPGEVHFMTEFPQAGKYKLWGQFNRNGKIVTTDFWVNVK
ncbi:hypothetical protein IQ264_26160 [Phormidium sp. LEGE 05292]|uniref:hypothetical protein n=1 Tax=[Phormidium] sp. LEGE 05292 TaxID=767427 RepID=UPI00187F2C2F|nr:hypothetical protein [Phormidium sp. LEGE 05292]MBE9228901.1 hypothetical protein [Phormidium sp. LEGE 05292]